MPVFLPAHNAPIMGVGGGGSIEMLRKELSSKRSPVVWIARLRTCDCIIDTVSDDKNETCKFPCNFKIAIMQSS